ncbi:MAG: twin-arginine translocation signal domain-containing protein, partial [Acidobacteriota bacterium]
MSPINRRDFLKLALSTGMLSGTGLGM